MGAKRKEWWGGHHLTCKPVLVRKLRLPSTQALLCTPSL